jgi:hypothetical protein
MLDADGPSPHRRVLIVDGGKGDGSDQTEFGSVECHVDVVMDPAQTALGINQRATARAEAVADAASERARALRPDAAG